MDSRITCITLGVVDLARARRFYCDGLGLKAAGGTDDVVFIDMNGTVLALWSRQALAEDAQIQDDGRGFGGHSLAQNVASREAVDALLAEAKAAGAKILKPGTETFWGGYAGYFADPDGHLWEVAHNPFWRLLDDGRVSLEPPTG